MNEAATSSRPPLALIATGEEWSARALESILAPAGYAILRAYRAVEALDRARSAEPDLVLLDFSLPDQSGIEVCRRLRQDPRISAGTPILITSSGPATRERRLAALRAGAWQFLGAPLDPEELLLKLELYVRARRELDRATQGALVDAASGLYNARGILRRGRELRSEAYRHRRPLAYVLFAPVLTDNQERSATEKRWRAAGDQLAATFKRVGRLSDAVGRVAPAEFIVIAPATDATGALKLARRLIGEAERAARAEGEPQIRLRAGCCAVSDGQGETLQPSDFLGRARLALRRAQADLEGDAVRFDDGGPDTPAP